MDSLDFLALFGIDEIAQRMIDNGVVRLLKELTGSGQPHVAEAAATFLQARKSESKPDKE
jgi:hypothetical protein